MTNLRYYEAPLGFTPGGFIGPPHLDRAIRVVAPPNARSAHSLVGSICRDLGATGDVYTRATGQTLMLAAAAARARAYGVTDVYVAVAEDLQRFAILDCIEFTGLLGANLHLVFSHGEVHRHARTLHEINFELTPYDRLAPSLTATETSVGTAAEITSDATEERLERQDSTAWDGVEMPADDWVTFRAACHATLPTATVTAVDRVYLAAYATARTSPARTPEDIAQLTGTLWQRHGISDPVRLVVCRAVQAAMFRNGLLVRIDLHHFTRHVQLNYVNLMTAEHYTQMAGLLHPLRAAATVLHAHHVSTETSLALTTDDVTPDGDIPGLDLTLEPEARRLIATQRWYQLLDGDDHPPLLPGNSVGLRAGIRKVVKQFDLPLIPYWRTLSDDRGRGNIGIKVEEYQ